MSAPGNTGADPRRRPINLGSNTNKDLPNANSFGSAGSGQQPHTGQYPPARYASPTAGMQGPPSQTPYPNPSQQKHGPSGGAGSTPSGAPYLNNPSPPNYGNQPNRPAYQTGIHPASSGNPPFQSGIHPASSSIPPYQTGFHPPAPSGQQQFSTGFYGPPSGNRQPVTGIQGPPSGFHPPATGIHPPSRPSTAISGPRRLMVYEFDQIVAAGTGTLIRALRAYVYPKNPGAFHQIVAGGDVAMIEALRAYVDVNPPQTQESSMPVDVSARQRPNTGSLSSSGIHRKTTGFRVQPKEIEKPDPWANWQYGFQIVKESFIMIFLIGISIIGAWFLVYHLGFMDVASPYVFFGLE